jgi:hypothetical protein
MHLCANVTARKPITKWARVKNRNKTQRQGNPYNLNNSNIIIIVIPLTQIKFIIERWEK